jgi:hypothetical protein
MMSSTYVKSLVCITLTTEDWNTLHEIAEDSGDSVAGTISAMIETVLERLQEETEYIDSIGGRAEGDESSPKQYDIPSLFL